MTRAVTLNKNKSPVRERMSSLNNYKRIYRRRKKTKKTHISTSINQWAVLVLGLGMNMNKLCQINLFFWSSSDPEVILVPKKATGIFKKSKEKHINQSFDTCNICHRNWLWHHIEFFSLEPKNMFAQWRLHLKNV